MEVPSAKLISWSLPEVKGVLDSTRAGLNAGQNPKDTKSKKTGRDHDDKEKKSGSYYMFDVSGEKKVSVFKPLDEEANAVNDPREKSDSIKEESLGKAISVTGEGLKKGTKAGKGGFREAIAYLLDHPKSGETKGFAGVPPTTIVSCYHAVFNHPKGGPVTAKLGSLQKYMENYGDCSDYGPPFFSKFPLDEVHKIAVLDMRFANADRHGGNLLISKSDDVLIPIDHGYCLPQSFEDMTFIWLAWPQARKHFSDETREYIKTLDVEKDIRLLEDHGSGLLQKTARVFRISTMLLKKGAERDLTPYTIGNIMCRDYPGNKGLVKKKSVIEEIVEEASKLSGEDDDKFFEDVSRVMDRRLGEIDPSDISL